MRRALLCVTGLVLACGVCSAASVTEIPMNAWAVVAGGSEVADDHLLLRNESAVEASVGMEVGRVEMTARTTEERRKGVLTHLTLTYDDGAEETTSLRVPADTQRHEVTFEPEFSTWRRVVKLTLMHPADRMELRVTHLRAVAEQPSMRLSPEEITKAKIEGARDLKDGLLKVSTTVAGREIAMAAPLSREIIVIAAKVDRSRWGLRSEKNLMLSAVDRQGRVLERYSQPLDGRVQPVLFYLHGLNPAQIDRLVFETEGHTQFAIRKIISGGLTSTGEKWRGLEQVNDRLDLLIGILEQGDKLSQQMLWQLKQLLLDYRRLE